jgi:hypothetical protein
MSKTLTNINNSVYDFELSLISTTKGSELIVPIPKGAVEYLEIEENLANFGVIGKCRIANFYGILEQLNVFDTKSMNCMYVRITNTDFIQANEVDANTTISFLALLKQSVDSSTNIVNKSINFTFEEYFIARTKMESIDDTFKLIEGHAGEVIKALFEFSNKESLTPTKLSTLWPGIEKDFFNFDGIVPLKVRITDFYDGDNVKTIYDLIRECYKYVAYSASGPGLLTMASIVDGGTIKRKVTLQPISSYTQGFYEKYQANATDLSQYVVEEFIIGNDTRSNTLNTNFIDSYKLIRTNQTDLLSNKWIDYLIADHNIDISKAEGDVVYYTDTKINFSTELLKGLNANLPDRNTIEEKVSLKRIHKKISDPFLTRYYVENTLKRSFIFDNTAITFIVQGNTYRQPGKFIKLQLTTADLIKKGNADSKVVDGYWFITGLKHIFQGDFYTNEFICVMLHGDGKATTSNSPTNPSFINILDSNNTPSISSQQSSSIDSQDQGSPPTLNSTGLSFPLGSRVIADGMVLPPKEGTTDVFDPNTGKFIGTDEQQGPIDPNASDLIPE